MATSGWFILGKPDEVSMREREEECDTRRFKVPPQMLRDHPEDEQRTSGVHETPRTLRAVEGVRAATEHARRSVPPPPPPAALRPTLPLRSVGSASQPGGPSATTRTPMAPRGEAYVSLAEMSALLRAFQELVGLVAPWLLKQALIERGCVPSRVPVGQLSSLVEALARHLDSPEAKGRFRASLASALTLDLSAGPGSSRRGG